MDIGLAVVFVLVTLSVAVMVSKVEKYFTSLSFAAKT